MNDINIKKYFKVNLILLVSASFFIFFAGPIGALQNKLGAYHSYIFRFVLIFAGLFISLIASFSNFVPKHYSVNSIIIIIFYIFSSSITFLLNPESRFYTVLQISGLIMWILIGIFIAQAVNFSEEGIASIIIGYLLANMVFVLLTCFNMVLNFQENFNPVNGRFIGPFDGSTVVSEIFFAPLLVGVAMIFFDKYMLGLSIAFASLIFIYMTGVRSAALVSLVIMFLFIIFIAKSFIKVNKFRLFVLTCIFFAIFSLVIIYINGGIIMERYRWDNILNEGRLQIWLFGIDVIDSKSFLFGKGIRAELFTDLQMYQDYNKIAVAWHNTWLAIFIEAGIIGLISYLLILLTGLRRFINKYFLLNKSNMIQKVLFSCAILLCLRYMIMSITEMNMYTALSPGIIYYCIIFGYFSVNNVNARLGN